VYETAQTSITLLIPREPPAMTIFRLAIAEARHLVRQRDTIEHLATELLGSHANFQRLPQVPGIGPINALTILAEVGDLRRVRHYRSF
jgi:transposase